MQIGDAVIRLVGSHDKGYIEGFPETGKARVKWITRNTLIGDEGFLSRSTIRVENIAPYSDAMKTELCAKANAKFNCPPRRRYA